MATDRPFSLEEIADRLAIEYVIARYVHALDARDYDALDDAFMPDTWFDLTEAGGITGSSVKVKRVLPGEPRRIRQLPAHVHQHPAGV